jgi:UDP-3-O-acyl-N-acetylglucosamine deacetylase
MHTEFAGLGLFGGKAARLTLEPAPVLSVRVDGGRAIPVSPALAQAGGDTAWAGGVPAQAIRNTTLRLPGLPGPTGQTGQTGLPGAVFATCEHVLSALAGMSMWGVCVHLQAGPEVPIGDGSALPFVRLLRQSGLRSGAHASPEPLVVRRELRVQEGQASIVVRPLRAGEARSMRYDIDYGPSAPWLAGSAVWDGSAESYEREIAPARTFSLLAEAQRAQAAGLFAHLSPKDMLVLGDDGAPIDNRLRFADEPARHKLLDLIGDLALLGRPIAGHVHAVRSGHALAARCAAMLAEHA